MAKDHTITSEKFDLLLGWLDQNREAAGEKYEVIRKRLTRIFVGRGCHEAAELVDETIDRVSEKLPTLAESFVGDPVNYFYGVANNIHLEWLRKQNRTRELTVDPVQRPDLSEPDLEYECFESCLERLPGDQRTLIVEYYRDNKSAKIENRRRLAETFKLSGNALQTKAYRIRSQLRACIDKCLKRKNAARF